MLHHLLKSSHLDDSNKWSNIGFGEEITHVVPIEINNTLLILGSGTKLSFSLSIRLLSLRGGHLW